MDEEKTVVKSTAPDPPRYNRGLVLFGLGIVGCVTAWLPIFSIVVWIRANRLLRQSATKEEVDPRELHLAVAGRVLAMYGVFVSCIGLALK